MDLPNSLIATEVGMRVADIGARVRGTLVMICWLGECGLTGIAYNIRERMFTCVIAAAGLRMNYRQPKAASRAKWGRKNRLSARGGFRWVQQDFHARRRARAV
ncbi:hypothetical protein [Burkholderia sp. Z1]|uniref:hypothetical protein n=1 Tax=Burkholderia sp. Z1 TaxID=2759039 RepID=UPI001866B7EA|nr:hypothetical protein [Burkholderia sp. Z1]